MSVSSKDESQESYINSCAPFVKKLLQIFKHPKNILENSKKVLYWSSDGNAIVITDTNKFTETILPLYFKQVNHHSFIRQLNAHGFKKVDVVVADDMKKSQYLIYAHVNFKKDNPESWHRVKRVKDYNKRKPRSDSRKREIDESDDEVASTHDYIKRMKQANTELKFLVNQVTQQQSLLMDQQKSLQW